MGDLVNFLDLYGSIPKAPAYAMYISHLIRYGRAYQKYKVFFLGIPCLQRDYTTKDILQGN